MSRDLPGILRLLDFAAKFADGVKPDLLRMRTQPMDAYCHRVLPERGSATAADRDGRPAKDGYHG
ncbi:hypothetical protein [uncultured Tateyamaria sp.]|uniref:hypothetical protein n=1 Tax=uncultured Tateyamaria sp. TaxID=455651 RepID=UPI00261E36E6|nr:hypothetical protein [uncultured Tateyamaria sp.]